MPSNQDLGWSPSELGALKKLGQIDVPISQSVPVVPMKVCIYRSNNVSKVEVYDTLNKMFGHYSHEQIKFILAGIVGNTSAVDWIEEHQYEFETYDRTNGYHFQEMLKSDINIFIEFNRKGSGTSILGQQLEEMGIYTYVVEL